jgi:triosephosphate isomerase
VIVRTPIILVNFKCYEEATGKSALRLAKEASRIANETGVNISVAPQFVDIFSVASSTDIQVYAQHMDPQRPGSHTGHVTAEALKSAGAFGTLLNHSERRLRISEIENSISRAREVGLATVVCANSTIACAAVAVLQPDMVAVEPPELIESGIAVSRARPEVVTEAVLKSKKANPSIRVLCGAGIISGEDVSRALRLGADGVLVASGIVKAKDQGKALRELADACSRLS